MPTVISHAVAAAALIAAFPQKAVPRRLLFLGAACSMAPDVDVIGFSLGIGYADVLGHRGLTHSLLFAAALALIAQLAMFPRPNSCVHRGWVWFYLFLATASHGLLDAITDGGLGVAFFSPFDTTRYFFPFTPIKVFSSRGFHVLLNEFQWVWLPSFGFAAVAFLLRRFCGSRFRSTL